MTAAEIRTAARHMVRTGLAANLAAAHTAIVAAEAAAVAAAWHDGEPDAIWCEICGAPGRTVPAPSGDTMDACKPCERYERRQALIDGCDELDDMTPAQAARRIRQIELEMA